MPLDAVSRHYGHRQLTESAEIKGYSVVQTKIDIRAGRVVTPGPAAPSVTPITPRHLHQ